MPVAHCVRLYPGRAAAGRGSRSYLHSRRRCGIVRGTIKDDRKESTGPLPCYLEHPFLASFYGPTLLIIAWGYFPPPCGDEASLLECGQLAILTARINQWLICHER